MAGVTQASLMSRASLRRRVASVGIGLLAANLAGWAWALIAFREHPALLGTAALAYSLGLRHAFDADHIAAIDAVTRKLMQGGQRPLGVGLFFSLGHSTIVVLASAGVALAAFAFKDRLELMHGLGGVVGTTISSLFLLSIAAANLVILVAICRSFVRLRSGEPVADDQVDRLLSGGGLLARIWWPLFRLIGRSWHMYPLGVLFGLGFDTATEVGVLGLSAAGASHGLPIVSIMVFPALFTAGMTLMDTADSILMVGAYDWAFAKPIRKLYYNMAITFLSVVVALLVGGVEALGLIADQWGTTGGFWTVVRTLNDNFAAVGFAIVAVFLLGWAGSVALHRARG